MDAFSRLLVSRFPSLSRLLMPSLLALRYFATPADAYYRCCVDAALAAAGMDAPRLRRRLHALPYRLRAEQHFFQHAKIDALRRTRLSIPNGEPVRAAIQSRGDRGVVFACSNFGALHYSIAALADLVDEVLLLSGEADAHVRQLCSKASDLTGIAVHAVSADASAGLHVLRQLKRRGAVIALLDSYYGSEGGFASPFMGRPAASSEGIYTLAARSGALVVPNALLRVRGGFELDVGDVIDAATSGVEGTCRAVHTFYERCVRAHPEHWMSWPNLLARWNLAAEPCPPLPTSTELS